MRSGRKVVLGNLHGQPTMAPSCYINRADHFPRCISPFGTNDRVLAGYVHAPRLCACPHWCGLHPGRLQLLRVQLATPGLPQRSTDVRSDYLPSSWARQNSIRKVQTMYSYSVFAIQKPRVRLSGVHVFHVGSLLLLVIRECKQYIH